MNQYYREIIYFFNCLNENNIEECQKIITPGCTYLNVVYSLTYGNKAGRHIFPEFYNFTPLTFAITRGHYQLVKILIDAGVDVNQKILECEYFSCTPLMIATKHKYSKIVKILIDAGADVNQKNYSGCTALYLSLYNDDSFKIFKLLLSKTDINLQNIIGETALMKAVRLNKFQQFILLLKAGANPNLQNSTGNTALHSAIYADKKKMFEILIAYNADTKIKNNKNESVHDLLSNYSSPIDIYSQIFENVKQKKLAEKENDVNMLIEQFKDLGKANIIETDEFKNIEEIWINSPEAQAQSKFSIAEQIDRISTAKQRFISEHRKPKIINTTFLICTKSDRPFIFDHIICVDDNGKEYPLIDQFESNIVKYVGFVHKTNKKNPQEHFYVKFDRLSCPIQIWRNNMWIPNQIFNTDCIVLKIPTNNIKLEYHILPIGMAFNNQNLTQELYVKFPLHDLNYCKNNSYRVN